MPLLQRLDSIRFTFQGRRASPRSALCPWLLHSRALGAQESNNHNFNSLHFQVESAIHVSRFTIHDFRIHASSSILGALLISLRPIWR